jgi:outer membrane immunogenic protein
MKTFLGITAAAALLTVTAFTTQAVAADLPPPAPIFVPDVYDWNGFYLGANAGYGWGDAGWSFPSGTVTTSASIDGFIGGGQLGWQKQSGNVVFGIEGQFMGADISGGKICPGVPVMCENELSWLGLAGVRLGYAFDGSPVLAYINGGYAVASIKTLTTVPLTGALITQDRQTHHGWYIGGGIDYGVNSNWIVGAEFNYVDLGSERHVPGDAGNRRDVEADLYVIRGRISFLFNSGN